MPRSRNVKHSFFANDELAEHDPLARLLFVGLWTIADYKGDLEWRPKRIKAQLLPYDECDINKIAINLDKSGFVRTYIIDGQMYLNITNFIKHQNPHKNERDKGSEIPPFTDEAAQAIDFKGIKIYRDKIGSDPDKNDSDPADSCSLIPDSCSLIPDSCSLIPDEKPLSGSPDIARQVIEYLNLVSGSNYQHVESNNKLIRARIEEGRTFEDIKAVIDRKNQEWPPGNQQRQYLRPSTLFNATKFNDYYGQIGQSLPEQNNGKHQQNGRKPSHADIVREQAKRAIAEMDAEDAKASDGSIHQDGNVISEQGGQLLDL